MGHQHLKAWSRGFCKNAEDLPDLQEVQLTHAPAYQIVSHQASGLAALAERDEVSIQLLAHGLNRGN